MTNTDRYLRLLRKSLLNQLYLDNELRIQYLLKCLSGDEEYSPAGFLDIIDRRPEAWAQLQQWRRDGWADNEAMAGIPYSRTMLSESRLDNIADCVRTVIADGVPGDLIECGVWRGGGAVFMKGVLEALGDRDRSVWLADSFQGLPVPSEEFDLGLDLSRELYPHLAVSRAEVERVFRDYELLDERVRFLEGWFRDTLPGAPVETIALLRLDGDLYESTRDALQALYQRVAPGGYIIIDDYFLPPCRRAVEEFREAGGIDDAIVRIDWTGVFWRKSRHL